MTNDQLLKQIQEELTEITPDKTGSEIHSSLQRVTRSVNRVSIEDKESGLLLRKLANDLMLVYSSEIQFRKLNNSPDAAKSYFSDSFFRSMDIIRKEIFKLVAKQLG